jgi:hypothetical protein
VIRFLNALGNIVASPNVSGLNCTWSNWFMIQFTVVKYPPSLAYQTWTLGILHTIFWSCLKYFSFASTTLLNPTKLTATWAYFIHILVTFGKSSLFFYLLHVPLFFGLGIWIRSQVDPEGISLLSLLPIWIGILVLLFGACSWYATFKHSKPADSLWRFL